MYRNDRPTDFGTCGSEDFITVVGPVGHPRKRINTFAHLMPPPPADIWRNAKHYANPNARHDLSALDYRDYCAIKDEVIKEVRTSCTHIIYIHMRLSG